MKFITSLLAATALLISTHASASVDCGPAKIVAIQSQTTVILVKIEFAGSIVWKNLSAHTAAYSASFQALAQQAMATDKTVVLRFPDGHVCSTTNYSDTPEMIRLSN